MGQQLRFTTSQELEAFLFQKARLRYRMGEPMLTMRDLTAERDQQRRCPTRSWQISVFAVDEGEQPIAGRSVDLFVYADTAPGVTDMLELFTEYHEAIGEVWDARHSRCCGFASWDAAYGGEYRSLEEAQARHAECKAITRYLRLLLGPRLFSVFRTMVL